MTNRIYLYELESYKRATPQQIKSMYMSADRFFDLDELPNETLREEMRAFLMERGNRLSITSIAREVPAYNLVCRFVNEKERKLCSFRDKPIKELERKLKAWLMKQGFKISYARSSIVYPEKSPADVGSVAFLKKLYRFLEPADNRAEQEKDVWELKKLDIQLIDNPIRSVHKLNFKPIKQQEMREELKTVIFMELKNVAVGTVLSEMSAFKRFSKYLAEKKPEVQSCKDIDRDVIESYLTYLNTEVIKKSFRTELIYIKTLLSLVGKVYDREDLGELFFTGDIPSEVRTLYRTYSDNEIARLNTHIVQMNEQIARALIIHQMLGTRISDTLTLSPDCLYQKNGGYIIKVKQVKSSYYEKPVSEELAALIQKAISYTKERYGESRYIFVCENDPSRPYQYSMIQNQVMNMIHREDLRDDSGELFGFNTHLFRHTYGRKLTEMHLDDYTIARLLGHTGTGSVKYYRKLSNSTLEQETREMREEMDSILLDLVKEWEEYGEV